MENLQQMFLIHLWMNKICMVLKLIIITAPEICIYNVYRWSTNNDLIGNCLYQGQDADYIETISLIYKCTQWNVCANNLLNKMVFFHQSN